MGINWNSLLHLCGVLIAFSSVALWAIHMKYKNGVKDTVLKNHKEMLDELKNKQKSLDEDSGEIKIKQGKISEKVKELEKDNGKIKDKQAEIGTNITKINGILENIETRFDTIHRQIDSSLTFQIEQNEKISEGISILLTEKGKERRRKPRKPQT